MMMMAQQRSSGYRHTLPTLTWLVRRPPAALAAPLQSPTRGLAVGAQPKPARQAPRDRRGGAHTRKPVQHNSKFLVSRASGMPACAVEGPRGPSTEAPCCGKTSTGRGMPGTNPLAQWTLVHIPLGLPQRHGPNGSTGAFDFLARPSRGRAHPRGPCRSSRHPGIHPPNIPLNLNP
jgi:hypothetical protein